MLSPASFRPASPFWVLVLVYFYTGICDVTITTKRNYQIGLRYVVLPVKGRRSIKNLVPEYCSFIFLQHPLFADQRRVLFVVWKFHAWWWRCWWQWHVCLPQRPCQLQRRHGRLTELRRRLNPTIRHLPGATPTPSFVFSLFIWWFNQQKYQMLPKKSKYQNSISFIKFYEGWSKSFFEMFPKKTESNSCSSWKKTQNLCGDSSANAAC